ncbi:hypothetical protein IJG27_02690 [Candidatus Saccharibacteria bacterium]|nr:hypothetical protein [Candidatus Saccharibacteria bacterium]
MTIKTKKGMASLYLVAFTTLLLGILTMSFVRVMLTESKESTNSDLSQSAYDSALAGIEDAKTAIIMYNTCRENQYNDVQFSFRSRCYDPDNGIIALMEKSFTAFQQGGDGSCDTVPKILGIDYSNGAVVVGDEKLNQFYTCVTVTNEADSYLTILGETTPSRTIPVRLRDGEFSKVVAFEIEWYSRDKDENDSSISISRGYMADLLTDLSTYPSNFKPFGTKSQAISNLPILAAEIIQTDTNFQMYELDLNNESNTGTDHATAVLYPVSNKISGVTKPDRGTFVTNYINKDTVLAVSNKNSAEREKSPQSVYCAPVAGQAGFNSADYSDSEYRCRATIEIPPTYQGNGPSGRAEHTFMVRINLPYGVPEDTDVSIKACMATIGGVCTEYAHWVNQFVVDSTGRASTLYRRLTARVDTVNTIFIYPDYAAEARGANATVEKRLYATKNCWATDDAGGSTTCANNGDAKIYPEEEPNTTN